MFDEMIKDFKELAELKNYAEAQYNTIVELTKKKQHLENEVLHLKGLLESTAPLLPTENLVEKLITSDEEAIAKMQLSKLRDLSLTRELTLEEAKRFEIFYKVLNSLRSNSKTIDGKSKSLKDNELLALLEQPESNENK